MVRRLRTDVQDRYRKAAGNLVLEEHPADVGVVLRWRDPRAGVPLRLTLYAVVPPSIWLNGQPVTSTRPPLRPGDAVLALHFDRLPRRPGVLAAALDLDEGPSERGSPLEGQRLVTTADGSWVYATHAPTGDSWMHPGTRTRGWRPMLELPARRPRAGEPALAEAWDHTREAGAKVLGPSEHSPQLWVRFAFHLGDDGLRCVGEGA